MSKIPAYYVSQTLLSGGDVNRRTIYKRGKPPREFKDERIVCVFNQHMRDWTAENEHELNICLKALLKSVEQTADTIPQPQSETPPSGTPVLPAKPE
jgi:hypothetical protein